MNKKDSFYKIGEVDLYVNRDQALRAKNLIKNIGSE